MRLKKTVVLLFSIATLSSASNALAVTKPEPAAPIAAPLLDAEELVPMLKKGSLIIVMRHQRAAVSGRWDDFARPSSDCPAQRNLSAAGYASAIETGQSLRILNIPIGTVLASPMCRTMETARLAFGRATAKEELGHITEVRHRSEATASHDLTEVVQSLKPSGSNQVVVTHGGNVSAAYGISLSEGDMLFFKLTNNKPVLIGRASPPDFDLIANRQLAEQTSP